MTIDIERLEEGEARIAKKFVPRHCVICGGLANGWTFPEMTAHPTCLAKEVVRLQVLLETIEEQTGRMADDLQTAQNRLHAAWLTARQWTFRRSGK